MMKSEPRKESEAKACADASKAFVWLLVKPDAAIVSLGSRREWRARKRH